MAAVSRSAVSQALAGNGTLRVDTIATNLDALGFELKVALAKSGAARGGDGLGDRAWSEPLFTVSSQSLIRTSTHSADASLA